MKGGAVGLEGGAEGWFRGCSRVGLRVGLGWSRMGLGWFRGVGQGWG